MKASELRGLADADIREKIAGLEEEIFNLHFQATMGQLSNALRLRYLRRDIARARTILNENKRKKPVAPIQSAPKEKTVKEAAPKTSASNASASNASASKTAAPKVSVPTVSAPKGPIKEEHAKKKVAKKKPAVKTKATTKSTKKKKK
jgi:large subunit ribosomal protein L29